MGKEKLIEKIKEQIKENEEMVGVGLPAEDVGEVLNKNSELLKNIQLVFEFVVM